LGVGARRAGGILGFGGVVGGRLGVVGCVLGFCVFCWGGLGGWVVGVGACPCVGPGSGGGGVCDFRCWSCRLFLRWLLVKAASYRRTNRVRPGDRGEPRMGQRAISVALGIPPGARLFYDRSAFLVIARLLSRAPPPLVQLTTPPSPYAFFCDGR